jgi:DNA-directed RNA polymerase subunit RPC12/RpoP
MATRANPPLRIGDDGAPSGRRPRRAGSSEREVPPPRPDPSRAAASPSAEPAAVRSIGPPIQTQWGKNVPSSAPATPSHAAARLDAALHDLANALAAARAYAEVANRRNTGRSEEERQVLASLVQEIDRAGEIARLIRYRTFDDYAVGDVLTCMRCGSTFVHRRAAGKAAQCRRCKSFEVTRWRPPE